MKKTIITILILALIGAGAVYAFVAKNEKEFSTTEVQKGSITEKVSVTGNLVSLKRIKIKPKVKGQVEKVAVEVSDQVKKGDLLIRLDQERARTQVQKSEANIESTKQEIDLLETKLENAEKDLEQTKQTIAESIDQAQTDLESKQQNLKDVEETEQDNSKNAYEDSRTALDSNYLTVNKAYIEVDNVKDDYFSGNDQISLKVKDKTRGAESTLEESKISIDQANSTEDRTTTKNALNELKESAKELKEILRYTRDEACEDPRHEYKISATTKTTLNTQKSNVETAISNLTTAQQNIESQEIASRKNINTAQSESNSAQANLKQVKVEQEQKVTQAESKIEELKQELKLNKSKLESTKLDLVQAQRDLRDTTIEAPSKGTITKVDIEEGETANLEQNVVSMIVGRDFKIEADVSEVNIKGVKEGDKAEVDFDAFPKETYQGKVQKIYPAETVKEGVIYYRIEVILDNYPDKFKPGLTVNVDIITGQKENKLSVPFVAVKEDNQGSYVEVLNNNGEVKKKRVETGLKGENKVEITKGLQLGERVLISSVKKQE